jgi:pimeloyl-ACP methyl ester carboxylesterase
VFSSKNDAIATRLKAATMARLSARLIIDRQVRQDDDGYRWRFDPRWRMASPQYQTEAQVRAILGAVSCPALTVIAEDGLLASREDTEARLACLRSRQSVTLPGHHHLHMDTPEPVAAAINRFLDAVPALGGQYLI